MIIKNAYVYGADLHFHRWDLVVQNGVIIEIAEQGHLVNENKKESSCAISIEEARQIKEENPGQEVELDANHSYLIPGLVDLHFHGAMNFDVCDASQEAFETIAEYEALAGVLAICPATLTLSSDDLVKTLKEGAIFAKRQKQGKAKGADLIGFNMEGPFISPVKRGAQNPNFIRHFDPDLVETFLSASECLVKIIGLAPEENPGFEEKIQKISDKVVVSLAHTNADYDTAMRAFHAGACHAVHLYNAMTGLSHREPGVVGAVMDSPHVTAEIICDGIHIHPAAVRAAFKMMGEERMIFISDSLRSTGMPDGEYSLGGQRIVKQGKYCRLKENGNLAGSGSNLMDCMKHAVLAMQIPLETAVACASLHPARRLGVDDQYGSIEKGIKGNLVLLSSDGKLSTMAVIQNGNILTEE